MTVETTGLASVLQQIPARAVPDRLAAVTGTVRFETGSSGEAVTLRFRDGQVEVVTDEPDADVVVRGRAEVVAAVVAGERNAGLEYLRGTLDLSGDTDLALAIGGLFEDADRPGTPVDPRVLDPVAVAVALGEVKGDHLKKVMRSGFREVVLGEIFRRLPDFVNPRKAAKVRLAVGFRLTGNPTGEVERYLVTIDHGTATVAAGESDPGERDATVTCQGHDFLKLATGHLNPVYGVLRGHLKVKGDQAKALQLSSVLDIPSA